MNLFLSLVLVIGLASTQGVDVAKVRSEIEAQYAKLADAHAKYDVEAILALRTADFHSIGPDGGVMGPATMAEYTRRFLADNKPPIQAKITIKSIDVSSDGTVAVATVFQEVTRFRQYDKQRKVATNVVQRETWLKTPQGWKLKVVDNVRDQMRLVDGKRVDPTKPYDANAPAFEPELLPLKLEVAAASAKQNSSGLVAWKLRNAALFMRNVAKDFNVTKADGTKITWDDLYANQKARMAAIKHIDYLIVTIDVESVSQTSAVVLSTQNWSRVVPGPDGKDIRMITGVTHREMWSKVTGEWKMERFTEENPTRKVEENVTVPTTPERYEVVVKLTETARRQP